jgi:hypothetical protein
MIALGFVNAMTFPMSANLKPDLKRLNGEQIVAVLAAAQQLKQSARGLFLEHVATALAHKDEPGDGDIGRAIKAALAILHGARRVML